MVSEIARVLYHESTILSRLDELAHQITSDYKGKELTVIAILNGSFIFMADLLRRIVWTDEASAAGGAQSELSALLAGPLGATVNDARLRAGLRLIELLGHLTAEPDPARIAALQRAQLLSTAIGAPHSTWP